jgi:FixJ family two-component response regulator
MAPVSQSGRVRINGHTRILSDMNVAFFQTVRESRMNEIIGQASAPVHIIEDDNAVSDSLVMLLRQLGRAVHAYPDAETFFAGGIPSPDEIVVVDLGLPGMNGSQVIRWLQSLRDPPRIVVITGQSQQGLDRMMHGIAVSHVIRKPLSAEAITAFV